MHAHFARLLWRWSVVQCYSRPFTEKVICWMCRTTNERCEFEFERLNLDSTYVAHTNGQWNHLTSGCTRWFIDGLAGSRFIRECSVVESSRIEIIRITITE